MRNRSVIGQIWSSLSRFYFFRRGMTEQSLNCLGKTPELKDRLTMLVMVGRSACRQCFRREVGIGPRSQNVFDYWDRSLRISSSVAGLKKVRSVLTPSVKYVVQSARNSSLGWSTRSLFRDLTIRQLSFSRSAKVGDHAPSSRSELSSPLVSRYKYRGASACGGYGSMPSHKNTWK